MTVIAWDGEMLAADKMAGDSWVKCGITTKIRRIGDHLIGCAGDSALTREMVEWFENGADKEKFPASLRDKENVTTMMVIAANNGQSRVSIYQHSPHPFEISSDCWAIGSGREAALAVMRCGFTARGAVEVASEVCANVGNGVDFLYLNKTQGAIDENNTGSAAQLGNVVPLG